MLGSSGGPGVPHSPFSEGGAKSMKLRHRSPATHINSTSVTISTTIQGFAKEILSERRTKAMIFFFLQLFDIPASRRRRANTIMNKRRTCRQRSFAAASCCPGKAHQTSAATHAGASHFAFFVGFFLPPTFQRLAWKVFGKCVRSAREHGE